MEVFMVNKEELLKDIQNNYSEKVPDEMEKQQILQMGRIFSLTTIVILLINLGINGYFHNLNGVAESAWIGFTTIGVAQLYLAKKQKKKVEAWGSIVLILIGLFFLFGYIVRLMGM